MELNERLLQSDSKYVCVTGGIGSGKSHALYEAALSELWNHNNNMGLIICDYKDGAAADFIKIIPGYVKKMDRSSLWSPLITISNKDNGKSMIGFMSYHDFERKYLMLRGMNLGFVCIDPADELSETDFRELGRRLRRRPSGQRMFLSANPLDIDENHWLYKRFHADSPDRLPNAEMIVGTYLDIR